MCGIAGFTGAGSAQTLEKMVDSLTHRGPDGRGTWASSEVSMGMRRLAIVDLEGGQQPVFNEDKTLVAIMNGEIFNHQVLRAELEKKGHTFRSNHSDTEVIPHLYEEYGLDFLDKLNGMFAIALWDAPKQTLLLARDHCGIKPLFYSSRNNNLIFGSEIKALLHHPSIEKRPNFKALYHYFSLKNVPAPWSAFEGVEQLRNGGFLTFKKGQLQVGRWWRPGFSESPNIPEDDAKIEIRKLLEKSVHLQMQTDVPFGAYLSGGVDSSAVVALMSQLGAKRIKTFTLAYEDQYKGKDNDRLYAEQVSRVYNTDHHTHVMNAKEVQDALPNVLEAFDEPFSGTVSTYFLTRLISKHVKVALSGDGADELFGSYLTHRLAFPLDHYCKNIFGKREPRESDRQFLQPFAEDTSLLETLSKLPTQAARRDHLSVWSDKEKVELLSPRFHDLAKGTSTQSYFAGIFAESTKLDPLNQALHLDFEALLPDQVLSFVDRLSMAHSVEVRPPFLDRHLVDYVLKLSGRYKIKYGRNKSILKDAVKDLLPAEILDRPKEGFVLPVNDWLTGPLHAFAQDLLSDQRLDEHGLFNVPHVKKILQDHNSGARPQPMKVWNLVNFQSWWQKYFA
ncbi:MAG: asparagine synthase (glutamine-hydrolyzing) [Bdellovibrionales bacterium]